MKKNKKKILNGILIAMSCLLATGVILQVTNVLDFTSLFGEEKNHINKNGGTAVPSSGHIDKVYFNKDLSINDVTKILDKIEPHSNFDSMSGYMVWQKDTDDNYRTASCMIIWLQDGISIYYNHQGLENVVVFNTSPTIASEENVNTDGWQEFDNPITIDIDVISTSFNSTITIGNQNNILKDLISITPFK